MRSNLVNFAGIVAVGIGSALFHGVGLFQNPPWHIVYSDIVPFFEKAIEPGFPYIGKIIEYPVLTGLFVHLMGILGGGTEMGYYFATSLFLIAFAISTTYLLVRMRERISDQKPLFLFWALAPSMLIFMIYNWDIIAIFFTVFGLYMMQKEKPYASSAFFALGFASKFYPIIYMAPLLLSLTLRGKRSLAMLGAGSAIPLFPTGLPRSPAAAGSIAMTVLVFFATVFTLNGLFMIASWQNWSHFFVFNRLREANPDSIWTVIQFMIGPLEVSTINIVSLLLFVASYGAFLWRYKNVDPLFLCFGGTLLFLFFNKVFSPQYLLWLLPFFVLIPVKKKLFYSLEIANLAALFSILAWFFLGREAIYLWFTMLFVVARHITLIGVFVELLFKTKTPRVRAGFLF